MTMWLGHVCVCVNEKIIAFPCQLRGDADNVYFPSFISAFNSLSVLCNIIFSVHFFCNKFFLGTIVSL